MICPVDLASDLSALRAARVGSAFVAHRPKMNPSMQTTTLAWRELATHCQRSVAYTPICFSGSCYLHRKVAYELTPAAPHRARRQAYLIDERRSHEQRQPGFRRYLFVLIWPRFHGIMLANKKRNYNALRCVVLTAATA